ncbi:MAG TPA: replicative DNA helicase [Gemmatimonadota bacterium]
MNVSGLPVGLEAPQGRVVPQSAEAEAAVLGAMLLDAAAIGRALETGLREEDFYHDHHRTLFRSVLRLYDARQAVDPVTLRDDLRRHAELDRAGGEEYLAELVSAVPTTANVEYHARIVLEYAIKRRLIAVGTEIVGDVYERADEPDSLLDRAEKRIFEIAERRLRPGFVHIKPLLHQTVELLDRISQNPDEVTGVPSGFRDLDRLTAGFQLSDLIIVAGRPGSGKTSLALNVAMHASLEHPFPVAVFSLEMSRDQLVQRMLCSEARVDSKKLRFEWKRPERFKYIIDVVNRLYNAKLYIDDTPSISVLEMRAKARRLKSEVDLGLIVVDYLQLMEVGPGFRRAENRQQEITVISRALKALAKELNVPVLALSQLSRAAEQHPGPPRLSDLRECVTGDTLVVLTDGRRAPIAELEGRTPDVYAIGAGGRIVRARADRVWRVGRRPVFEVRLASGRRMRATARHRLLTGDGWKRLEAIGLGERVAIARHAPEPLAPDRWPGEHLILLAHLIGDGSYLKHQPMRYTTASEENSRAVADSASHAFGADVKRYAGRGNWHQLLISGNGNRWRPAGVNRWLRYLGVFGQRSFEKRVPSVRPNTNTDTLPPQVFTRIRSRMATAGISQRRMVALRGTAYGGASHFMFAPSRGHVQQYAEILGDEDLEREATSDLFWDRVVSVVACGEEDVYDLTVPGPASWLADGIVSHNSGSIEQDSDLVLFLYQEQDGGKSERGGFETPLDQTTLVMDLIVAKHRNGPTGSMKLVFNRPFTRFESYSGRTEF